MFVVWLDVVTYLHHHGPSDKDEEVPWYRNEEWSYFRGGLSTIDRDYGACGQHWADRLGERRENGMAADIQSGVGVAGERAVADHLVCTPATRRSRPAAGIFNKIHHDIGTHVVHHLFPQVRALACC